MFTLITLLIQISRIAKIIETSKSLQLINLMIKHKNKRLKIFKREKEKRELEAFVRLFQIALYHKLAKLLKKIV